MNQQYPESVTMKYAPFAHQYLQNNYQQSQQANQVRNNNNQPQIIPIQRSNQVLDQIQSQYTYNKPINRIETDGIIHQHHTITHPQARDLYHREAAITVVSREEIESVWKSKCQQLESTLTEVQTEIMRLRGIGMSEKVTYVEDTLKINQLYLEIDRLNKCLLDMSLELENYKHKYNMATDKQSRQIADVQIDQMRAIMLENESIMNSEINRLRSSLDEWQKRYRILELSLSEARGGEAAIQEYETTISILRQDTDRLNYQISNLRGESDDWKLKYQRLEAQLREQSTSEIEIRRLKEMIDNRNREIETLRLNQGFENDSKYQQARIEQERLSNELRTKNEEISRLRQQISSLELRNADTSRFSDMEQRYQSLQRENESLSMRLQGSRTLESRLIELQELNDRLKQQNQQLNLEIEDWRMRYQELDNRFQDLEYQFTQTTQSEEVVTKLTTDVEIWKRKFMDLNREYHQTQEDFMMCQAELDSLKSKKTETVVIRQSVHSNASQIISNENKSSYDIPQYKQY